MGIFRLQRIFSEKKLSTLDKLNLATAKIGTKEGKEIRAKFYEDLSKGNIDEAATEIGKHERKRILQTGALATAFSTGLATTAKNKKAALMVAGLGAGGTAAGYLGNKLREITSKPLARKLTKDKDNRKLYEKTSDYYKVASGNMTKGEFTDKWGKKK